MKTPGLYFTLYTITVSFMLSSLNPAIAATQPSAGNETHFCGGVINYPPNKQFRNRNYARNFAANLNVGEPHTVRMIYFLPNDRPYQADVVQRMKTEIRFIQDFYAREMQAHGYGNITFRVETDPHGEPMVHRVDGGHPASHYDTNHPYQVVIDEIAMTFNLDMNIYLIVADESIKITRRGARGIASRRGKNGGWGLVDDSVDWAVVAHELGHAFGLQHNFSNNNYNAYIMSYGNYLSRLSACNAEYLSVHPYFNPNVQPEDTHPGIELISPRIYPAEAKNVSIQLKVSDAEGLHQVILFAETPPADITIFGSPSMAAGSPEVKACQSLGGETDTIVEFDYDGSVPSRDLMSLSVPTRHPISIEAIDVNGNTRRYRFNLESDSPKSYSMDQLGLFSGGIVLEGRSIAALSEHPDVGLVNFFLSRQNISDGEVAEVVSALLLYRPHLKSLDLDTNLISDLSPLASLTNLTELNLSGNNISDLSPLASLTNLTELNLDGNNISDISALAGLTNLTELTLDGNNISDISAVSGLTNLTVLWLWDNSISDISAVSGLTDLTWLNLRDNSISDISAVSGLTDLTRLNLSGNNISDLSPLASLTNLTELNLDGNNISDISALAGLPRLRYVSGRSSRLNYTSIYTHIPVLQARGAEVRFYQRRLARVKKISDDQHIAPATSLPIIVEVQDDSGFGFEGVPVTFTLTSGSGTLSTTFMSTDRNGQAESTLTLGVDLGTRIVEVSVPEIEQPVTFTIVGKKGVIIPDSNLRAKIGEALGKASADRISPSEIATLTVLRAQRAGISNLTGLEHATNLTELRLDDNNISDLSPVSGLTNLRYLRLDDNNISDISPVSGLTNLRYLRLDDNSVSDLSPVSGLPNLGSLYLYRNSISDLSPVLELTNLRYLRLDDNNISDISPVSGLTNLRELNLGGNSISDLSPVSELTNLTHLQLWDNNISDISVVSELTNLTYLSLSYNSISDLSPLVANTGLGSGDGVNVRRNRLSYTSIHTHIPALQGRGVEVRFDDQPHPALLKISGDNQTGAAGAALANPFVVEVQNPDGTGIAGISVTYAVTAGDGTLSAIHTTTDGNGRAESTLTLGPHLGTHTVSASVNQYISFTLSDGSWRANRVQWQVTFNAIADSELPPTTADVNSDGFVNVLDLILISSSLGQVGRNDADVNGDGVITVLDLVIVAGMFDDAAAAPSAQPQIPETLTAVEIQGWLTDARALEIRDPIMKRGFLVLEQLLISLTPKETELLSNYPNPFNPETWIPYRLAEDAFVTLTIYDGSGQVVRTLDVGHRIASTYESRSKAIYWDGRNDVGERVASGVYYYHLSAGDSAATRKMAILK